MADLAREPHEDHPDASSSGDGHGHWICDVCGQVTGNDAPVAPAHEVVEPGNCQHCGGELAWTRDWSQPPVRHAVSHPECPVNEDDWPIAAPPTEAIVEEAARAILELLRLREENERLRNLAVCDQAIEAAARALFYCDYPDCQWPWTPAVHDQYRHNAAAALRLARLAALSPEAPKEGGP